MVRMEEMVKMEKMVRMEETAQMARNGKDGADGIGITNVTINDADELVLSFSDGKNINLGCVVGQDGKDGYEWC